MCCFVFLLADMMSRLGQSCSSLQAALPLTVDIQSSPRAATSPHQKSPLPSPGTAQARTTPQQVALSPTPSWHSNSGSASMSPCHSTPTLPSSCSSGGDAPLNLSKPKIDKMFASMDPNANEAQKLAAMAAQLQGQLLFPAPPPPAHTHMSRSSMNPLPPTDMNSLAAASSVVTRPFNGQLHFVSNPYSGIPAITTLNSAMPGHVSTPSLSGKTSPISIDKVSPILHSQPMIRLNFAIHNIIIW